MTTTSLLKDLQRLGVDVTANGDKLVVNAPRGVLTPEMLSSIAEQKEVLLGLLSARPGCPNVDEMEEEEARWPIRPGEPPEPYRRFIAARKRLGVPYNVPLRVISPRGKGNLWQVWGTRIGVVLDSDPNRRVTFFEQAAEIEAIQPLEEMLTEVPEYLR
jgi:hypothetical protein